MRVTAYLDPAAADLSRRLRSVALRLKRRGLNAGLFAAAWPILAAVQQQTPRKYGALAKSFGLRQIRNKEKGKYGIAAKGQGYLIGPYKKVSDKGYQKSTRERVNRVNKAKGSKVRMRVKRITQWHKARWLEYGTKRHAIPDSRFGKRYYHHVVHPGIASRYFIRNSFSSEAFRAVDRFSVVVLQVLNDG